MKTLSEQIKELQDAIVAKRDALVEATKALQETPDDATEGAVVELTAELEKANARLESLTKAEKALGTGSLPAGSAGSPPAVIKSQLKNRENDNLYGKLALATYESRIKGVPIDMVLEMRFKGEGAVVELLKAAQNPAISSTAGYAQELTQMAYGQMMGLLREAAILPRATPLMQQHQFNGATSIYVPMRAGGATDAAGAFRAEGAPIPVKGLTFTSQSLTPKNMGVILTATEEMLSRSSIDLASYFQGAIITDTAEALDVLFLSNTAGSTTAPAGVQNGVTGGDTRAAAGTGTTANIVTDLKTMLTAMAVANMGGPGARFVMSTKNWYTVSMALTATGALQFPETANGMLANTPVLVTNRLADNLILLIDFAQITCAFGAPAFLASNVATIHEETVPTALSTAGTPNVVAAPIRSLFQTNSWALRMMMDADWKKLRAAGLVQQLTSVAWVG